MAQMTVRNIDEDTFRRLRERAARNKRSLEAEVRALLDAAVKPDRHAFKAWALEFLARQRPNETAWTTDAIRAERDAR